MSELLIGLMRLCFSMTNVNCLSATGGNLPVMVRFFDESADNRLWNSAERNCLSPATAKALLPRLDPFLYS